MIKDTDLEMRRLSDLARWAQSSHEFFKGKTFSRLWSKNDGTKEEEARVIKILRILSAVAALKMEEEGGQEPRNVGHLQKLEKASSLEPPEKKAALLTP